MYEIDSDVYVPEMRSGPKSKYPFKEMKVGQSFFVQGGSLVTVRAAMYKKAKKIGGGRKFWAENQPDGVRCWRVE